jgi:ABC-type multidrug transport system fused ATPase/permease subunit
MRAIVNRMSCDIRAGLLSSLFSMPVSGLSHEKVGDMMSRMIGDVEQVGASVRTTVTEIWDTVLLMLSYFIACMAYSPKITLLASIPIPFVVVLVQLIRSPLYRLSQKARKAASNVNVHLQHNISGIALLRLFGLEGADRRKLAGLLDEQLKWNIAASALQGAVAPLYILLATCGIVIVVGMGGELVVGSEWTIGMFTAYLSMFTAMAVRTNVIGRVMNTWHGARASWDRICEKLRNEWTESGLTSDDADIIHSTNYAKTHEAETPDAVSVQAPIAASVQTSAAATLLQTPATTSEQKTDEESVQSPDAASVQTSALNVRSLSFRYPFSESDCLNGISFFAGKGEIIGITGPVGSGKSALAAALSGLYPYGGEVCVNGVSLNDLGKRRGSIIAYMDSDQFVFSDDVVFNIALDRTDCVSTDTQAGNNTTADMPDAVATARTPAIVEKIREALSIAAMTEDIDSFENGLETKLMERGVRLSGGQRQRVSLARAWYGGADILILDDPFSAVDAAMEHQIMRNIRTRLGDRVVLCFSHRLSAFEMTDKVIVLEKGKISQMGAHGELLSNEGLYRDIYYAQRYIGGESET